MALDGIVIAALVQELRRTLLGGHIQKIAMPENNELLLTIKNNAAQHRLLISCEAALPLLYLQRENKPSPLTAPGFAMLLRKHIGSGKITAIEQLGLERIVRIETTQLNELGDIAPRALYVELMGKYSNIIFTDESNVILDSMRRVPASVSSLREVLPGRPYFVPEKLQKTNPLSLTEETFTTALAAESGLPLDRALSAAFSGISGLRRPRGLDDSRVSRRLGGPRCRGANRPDRQCGQALQEVHGLRPAHRGPGLRLLPGDPPDRRPLPGPPPARSGPLGRAGAVRRHRRRSGARTDRRRR